MGFTPPVYPNGFGVDEAIQLLHPLEWPSRPQMSSENLFTTGYLYQAGLLLNVSRDLGFFYDLTTVRGILTSEEQTVLTTFEQEFALRALVGGTQPGSSAAHLKSTGLDMIGSSQHGVSHCGRSLLGTGLAVPTHHAACSDTIRQRIDTQSSLVNAF